MKISDTLTNQKKELEFSDKVSQFETSILFSELIDSLSVSLTD